MSTILEGQPWILNSALHFLNSNNDCHSFEKKQIARLKQIIGQNEDGATSVRISDTQYYVTAILSKDVLQSCLLENARKSIAELVGSLIKISEGEWTTSRNNNVHHIRLIIKRAHLYCEERSLSHGKLANIYSADELITSLKQYFSRAPSEPVVNPLADVEDDLLHLAQTQFQETQRGLEIPGDDEDEKILAIVIPEMQLKALDNIDFWERRDIPLLSKPLLSTNVSTESYQIDYFEHLKPIHIIVDYSSW